MYYGQWGRPTIISAEEFEKADNSFRKKYPQRVAVKGWVRVCQECERRFPTQYAQKTMCSERCATRRRLRVQKNRYASMTPCARVGCEKRFDPVRSTQLFCSDRCWELRDVSANRKCLRCRESIHRDADKRKKYCSDRCRILHFQQKKRAAEKGYVLGRVLPPSKASTEG